MVEISIIPEPQSIKMSNNSLKLSEYMVIHYDLIFKDEADIIKKMLEKSLAITVNCVKNESKSGESDNYSLKTIKLIKNKAKLIPLEGYLLDINKTGILISSSSNKGIFYGIQTLRQILPPSLEDGKKKKNPKSIELPFLSINDEPRFPWRGFMVDEGRYFLGTNAIKKILDFMALLKLNKFHWHLTEDQGWRIEIKKYPLLTKIGSKRKGTPKDRNRNSNSDNTPHGGYYSQDQIKEIVEYASQRHIDVIPEIELPGHSMAALAAYPELSCTGGPFQVSWKWGIKKDVYCVGNPKTITFLEDVIEETANLFPCIYFHIGGDEVPKDRWKGCPKCQSKIEELSLNDENELQIHITNHFIDFLAEKGKKTIVWNDEVIDKMLDKRAICQYWRGSFSKIQEYVETGGKVIISPNRNYYVDVSYAFTPLSKTYKYNPVPDKLSEKGRKNVLGVEGEMWGEVFASIEKLEWNTFPRLFAIAESGWTQLENKSFEKFKKKLNHLFKRLDVLNIDYANPKEFEPNVLKKILLMRKGYYA